LKRLQQARELGARGSKWREHARKLDLPAGVLRKRAEALGVHASKRRVQARKLDVHASKRRVQTRKLGMQASKRRVQTGKLDVHASKVRVQTGKLDVHASKVRVQTRKLDVHASKLRVQTRKLDVHASKRRVQTGKLDLHASKVRAQARKLDVHASKVRVQTRKLDVHASKLRVQTGKLDVRASKPRVPTRKLRAPGSVARERARKLPGLSRKLRSHAAKAGGRPSTPPPHPARPASPSRTRLLPSRRQGARSPAPRSLLPLATAPGGQPVAPVLCGCAMTTPAPTVPLQLGALKGTSPRKATYVILAVSAAALLLLVGVIYGHGRATDAPAWVSYMPAVNATLNGTSAVFLVLAYRAIRRRDIQTHVRRVLVSLAASALFLVSYIVYHSVHGDTPFGGHGLVRPVYFFVLISHVVLSAVALPLVFLALFFSLSGRFPRHKSIARYTFPIWLYVSVTGVVVFAMLRLFG
jgi:putative membrane protein